MMNHYIILVLIIICCGLLGGVINYLRLQAEQKTLSQTFLKSVLTGLAASSLVPLFLRMISSDLLTTSSAEPIDYFVIGGFCLVTSIFSNKFIDTIGEKVLSEINTVSEEVRVVENDLENLTTEKESSDKTDLYSINEPIEGHELEVLLAINNSKYIYRALSKIAKETSIPKEDTLEFLNRLQIKELVEKSLRKNNQYKWKITENGQQYIAEHYGDEGLATPTPTH